MLHFCMNCKINLLRSVKRQFNTDKVSESYSVVSDSLRPHGLYSPWNSSGKNTGVGSLSFLQGIFPTQVSNPGLPYCRQILYQLSYKVSPVKVKVAQLCPTLCVYLQSERSGTSLVVQWLRVHTPKAWSPGLIPGQGTNSHMPCCN